MAFTIPNEADAFHADQAEPDKVDIDILVAGLNGNGVVSGCAVTAQVTPDMTTAVAAGVIRNADGTTASVAAGNVTHSTADATNPRIDLVGAGNTGTKAVTAGTAAANPVMPAIPANGVIFSAVYVPANDTAIASNQITDKRVVLSTKDSGLLAINQYAPATQVIYSTTSATMADVDATNMAVTATTPPSGNVLIVLSSYTDIGTSFSGQFGIREGTTNLGYATLVERGTGTNGRYARIAIYLTGISAGSHTYKWAFNVYTPGTAFRIIAGQSSSASQFAPPAIMEVWAAP